VPLTLLLLPLQQQRWQDRLAPWAACQLLQVALEPWVVGARPLTHLGES
jgi:hypothetical protein